MEMKDARWLAISFSEENPVLYYVNVSKVSIRSFQMKEWQNV